MEIHVIGYVANQTERARITGALRGWAPVLWVGSIGELPDAVQRAPLPPLATIVSARDQMGSDGSPVIRQLRSIAPDVPIVGHCHQGVDRAIDMRRLTEAGAHQFIFAGVDDTGLALRAVLASAQRTCAAQRVAVEMLALLPDPVGAVAQACVMHQPEGNTVAGVARMLGVDRKTLRNYCVRLGMPAPSELIGWSRLMAAAQLLTTTGQTVEWVAVELNYPSDTSLRNAMKRYTGMRVSAVVKGGGLPVVVRAFKRRLPPRG